MKDKQSWLISPVTSQFFLADMSMKIAGKGVKNACLMDSKKVMKMIINMDI